MRISGLASGMDIDALVKDLMRAERIPLDKLQQDRQWLTWQRDAYREMNTLLSSFNSQLLEIEMSSTYQSKITTSTQQQAVTATASTTVPPGSFSIEVSQLASQAVNASANEIIVNGETFDPNEPLINQENKFNGSLVTGNLTIITYDDNGQTIENEIIIDENDSLNVILRKISDLDNGIRAFYDTNSNRVFFERTDSGSRNEHGNEIEFAGEALGFITNTLGIDLNNEQGGTNALFRYNGIELESKTNSYTLNGLTFNFHSKTNGIAVIGVQNDIENAVDKIKEFVDKYNEIVETFNSKLTEQRHRDYPPLTNEQRQEMSENEIELWEERAMSGLLRGDSTLRTVLSNMRLSMNSIIDTGNPNIKMLSDVGITPSTNYSDNGKLNLDESKLREALQLDSDSVYKLFSNEDVNNNGISTQLRQDVRAGLNDISSIAGRVTQQDQQYSIGRRIGDLDNRISAFEDRLKRTEDRYFRQFTAMEQAISRANTQSMFLMQSFGGFIQQ